MDNAADAVHYRKQFVYHYAIFYLIRSVTIYAAYVTFGLTTNSIARNDDDVFSAVVTVRAFTIVVLISELFIGMAIIHTLGKPVNAMTRCAWRLLSIGNAIYGVFVFCVVVGFVVEHFVLLDEKKGFREVHLGSLTVCLVELLLRLPDYVVWICGFFLPDIEVGVGYPGPRPLP